MLIPNLFHEHRHGPICGASFIAFALSDFLVLIPVRHQLHQVFLRFLNWRQNVIAKDALTSDAQRLHSLVLSAIARVTAGSAR